MLLIIENPRRARTAVGIYVVIALTAVLLPLLTDNVLYAVSIPIAVFATLGTELFGRLWIAPGKEPRGYHSFLLVLTNLVFSAAAVCLLPLARIGVKSFGEVLALIGIAWVAIFAVHALILGLCALADVVLARFRRFLLPHECRRCGYDLTGNVSGRCPECGNAVA